MRDVLKPEERFAAMSGAALFAVCYIAIALWLEISWIPRLRGAGTPLLSYGQQSGVAMVLCGGLGASTALALCWSIRRQLLAADFSGPITALGIGAVNLLLWRSSVFRYGMDISDDVVYVPVLTVAAVSLILSSVGLALAIIRPRRTKEGN